MTRETQLELPIMPALAYPPHLLGVPQELWMINLLAATAIALLWGSLDGSGLKTEVMFLALPFGHLYFASAYQRDPHIFKVWRAAAGGPPRSCLAGTRNLLPKTHRRISRFSA